MAKIKDKDVTQEVDTQNVVSSTDPLAVEPKGVSESAEFRATKTNEAQTEDDGSGFYIIRN